MSLPNSGEGIICSCPISVILKRMLNAIYLNNIAALIVEPDYRISRVRVLALFALHGEKHLESCGG